MKVGAPEPHCLREEMPRRNAEWAAIVKKYDLRAPADLNAYVGGSFEFTDAVFAYGATQPPPASIVSTIKARQAGFPDCIDTEDMFRRCFAHAQQMRQLPAANPH
jgi:hypothetical protein